MNINEFNNDYLNELLNKLSKESITMFLLGDLNINLLKYDIYLPPNEILTLLYPIQFLEIKQPLYQATFHNFL